MHGVSEYHLSELYIVMQIYQFQCWIYNKCLYNKINNNKRKVFLDRRGIPAKIFWGLISIHTLKAFCILEHTIYILPTLLRSSFKLLLKSRNLKDHIISLNDTRTWLVDLLYESIAAASLASLNGVCRWTLRLLG